MAITFLHAADIHLDSPLKGLERYENAPVDRIRGATRRAFTRLIDLAIEKRVDFVLIAGDHDAANKMTRGLTLPDNVQLLSHDRPQTVRLKDLDVAIHGQSFAKEA